ncbi:MAG: hypothetical protein A3E07_02225 [Candidatus Wildermuthbacteria bacterium RIFCSPHIGHO2_12_FULL_45_9]|uniref:Antitoxin n=1 Tax=Candidatus Wildermuthbacteria bacterium RIFCSPHIGHO2_02_FULL_45_25 TaxID=1802450 RepID=A0A1G2R0T0_9BACT|nr:MAG: hypothetical protein A3C04_00030 [Candidatus Wildermuthbacteria bacterium RIFCSPHIGHO2_02_FULL_45_25]OHA70841.1 MAG: hypothetical protein A3E07_02225 [Candidatus Wildermuthbacteria bacterium RIFCSPHIGHO2_12_FULL_45_9]
MKNLKLDTTEKNILNEFEAGNLKQVKGGEKEKVRYQEYAKCTLSKPRNINIRVSRQDLQRIKAMAAERGLPYQTFISSLLHQFSARKTSRVLEEENM